MDLKLGEIRRKKTPRVSVPRAFHIDGCFLLADVSTLPSYASIMFSSLYSFPSVIFSVVWVSQNLTPPTSYLTTVPKN